MAARRHPPEQAITECQKQSYQCRSNQLMPSRKELVRTAFIAPPAHGRTQDRTERVSTIFNNSKNFKNSRLISSKLIFMHRHGRPASRFHKGGSQNPWSLLVLQLGQRLCGTHEFQTPSEKIDVCRITQKVDGKFPPTTWVTESTRKVSQSRHFFS